MAATAKSDTKSVAPARKRFMDELARLREESGLSLGALSERARFDRSYLNRLERGERIGDFETARRLDEVYGTGRGLQNLWWLAKDEAYPGRYQRYMELENEARIIQTYTSHAIHGLLQTKEYAREFLWSTPHRPDEEPKLEEQLALRMDRQLLLRRAESPAHARIVLDEAVFGRPLKDRGAWKQQLQRLIDDAALPNVTLQMLPLSTGLHDLLGGVATLLWLPDGTSAAYQEGAKNGEVIEEPSAVEQVKLSYDEISACALSQQDSLEFIRTLMKEG
ncbi:Helix-turn-helix domain-containing protein [Streptomyces zhaozhouensis]|uniref:Helix-turn-helix domain-containing protein n=1 Tax=Streptomyces zhaozhouensis TaxID=1300267 RepID=A0A286E1U5_9ACTN|nr:helix-turn-helix transcriptional regulator [Streptomyces zhaozhouensis]SOD64877.1 Helix-turn-helix domain-containing protein [Streptomyces zhaozhouensis]